VGLGQEAVIRSSDAGEPSGTAGRPILDAILKRDLTDVAVVVTRYFGGTKLGTGGLARAYRDCAGRAIDAAGSARKVLTVKYNLMFPYNLTKDVLRVIDKHGARIVDEEYDQQVRLTATIRQSRAEMFREELEMLEGLRVSAEAR
jgi:putative IMPACT (imprinted ancient) family translation regulator